MRCKTIFKKGVVAEDEALSTYNFLKNNIIWEEGVRSKKGFTRKAKPLHFGDLERIDLIIVKALSSITNQSYNINFIYLNYYEDGSHWCPNHNHPGTHQLVISLGETRTLQVAKKDYSMANGDAIIFGSAIHGVPKRDTQFGRISIAVFMDAVL